MNQIGLGLTRSTVRPLLPFYFQLLKQVNNVRMVVSSLWRGPGNIRDFILDGKSYRRGGVTAQTLTVPAVSRVVDATTYNLITIACGRVSLVNNKGE